MKEIYIGKYGDMIAYDGLKDYFGNKMYIVIHETLEEIRLYSKNKDYKKNRKKLDNSGHKNVYTPEYGEVIDISMSTLHKIKEHFPDYRLPLYKWQVRED